MTKKAADPFTDLLTRLLQRLVIDRTGLSERFDFNLEWKPNDQP